MWKTINWTRPSSGQTLSLCGRYEILKRRGYTLLINNRVQGTYPTLAQAKYNAESHAWRHTLARAAEARRAEENAR